MEDFEIGSCFKSYNELMEKFKTYCNETRTKFTTKDCRLIKDELVENIDAKNRLMYTDLKMICVHGRTNKPKKKEIKRKRLEKNEKTGCPAYFRLKLIHSGIALQIVALNVKHNHPLDAKPDEPPKSKKLKAGKEKLQKDAIAASELDIKDEDENGSDYDEPNHEVMELDEDEEEAADDTGKKLTFKGICAPVFTAFNPDMSVNVDIIPKYAKYLQDKDIKAVFIHGTAGEGPSLSMCERKTLAENWSQAVKSTKQHLMIQVGGCPLPDVIELSKHAEEIGANYLCCLPELYFKPSTIDELVEYLEIVSKAAPELPLLYYHNPSYTGVNLNMEQFLREEQGRIPTLVGIIYNSNDLDGAIAMLRAKNDDQLIFIGTDTLLSSAFALGFDSALTISSNVFPQYTQGILSSSIKSKMPKATEFQNKLSAACAAITKNGNLVSAMKAAMNLVAPFDVGPVRPPLKNSSEEQILEMKKSLKLK